RPDPVCGVPDKTPDPGLNVTPPGSVPFTVRLGVGVPVVVIVKLPNVPTVNVALFAPVIFGATPLGTLIAAVATFESAVPLLALYWKLSDELAELSLAYVKLPSPFSVSVPCCGLETRTAVSGLPFASRSLASTPGAGTLR